MISPFRAATCLKIATHGGRRDPRRYRVITQRIYARQLHSGCSNHTHDAEACSISSRRSVLDIRHWLRVGVTTANAQQRRQQPTTLMRSRFQPSADGVALAYVCEARTPPGGGDCFGVRQAYRCVVLCFVHLSTSGPRQARYLVSTAELLLHF